MPVVGCHLGLSGEEMLLSHPTPPQVPYLIYLSPYSSSLQLDRPTKQMREAEERLKAIPQFCFPDAKDWLPVSEYTR